MNVDSAVVMSIALSAMRVTAFLIVAPPFSHRGIPGPVKALLGVALALALGPGAVTTGMPTDAAGFLFASIAEIITGLALGFLVSLAFSAVTAAGGLIDLFGGFTLAQGFDPLSMINGAQFTRLFQFTALALLVVTDGYQMVLGGLSRSFGAVPLGASFDLAPTAEAIATGVGQFFLASLQIAGPLIIVLVLADVGLGLITRVAPALNAFSLGFPLKVLITLIVAGVAFITLPQIIDTLTADALTNMEGVR